MNLSEEHKKIYDEIIQLALDKKRAAGEEDWKIIDIEVQKLADTDGIKGWNNLDKFYNIIKTNLGQSKKQEKNEIHSWTAYFIGLTDLKPEDEFAPLRRVFARDGFPDIDTDFDDQKRDLVQEYLVDKYGTEYVANIAAHQTLKLRDTLTRVIKALDIADAYNDPNKDYVSANAAKVVEIMDTLPSLKGQAKMMVNTPDGQVEIKTIEDAYEHCEGFRYYMDQYPQIMEHVKNIQGLTSSFSAHAAGIVVGNEPLKYIAPARKTRKKNRHGEPIYATQFDGPELESIGLIKFDMLGLATMTVIKNACKLVKEHYGIEIDTENIPDSDPKALQIYRTGNTVGVFQCEGRGMQNTLKEISCDSFDDVVAAIALFRPGPMANIPEYCARKKGQKEVDYYHPSIEVLVKKYLQDTYGILVYQEQIMQVCHAMSGMSPTEGYSLIKAVSKKKFDVLNKYKQDFISGAEKNNVKASISESYWDDIIMPFAAYGFNRAHSAGYGYLSIQTAYLKAHYPEEFYCALLNSLLHRKAVDYDKIDNVIADMKRNGIDLGIKSINGCGADYMISKRRNVSAGIPKSVISPSLMVKGVGYNAAEEIFKQRPYSNLKEIALKVNPKYVKKDTISALVDHGFFKKFIDAYNKDHKGNKIKKDDIVNMYEQYKLDAKKAAKKSIDTSEGLFA